MTPRYSSYKCVARIVPSEKKHVTCFDHVKKLTFGHLRGFPKFWRGDSFEISQLTVRLFDVGFNLPVPFACFLFSRGSEFEITFCSEHTNFECSLWLHANLTLMQVEINAPICCLISYRGGHKPWKRMCFIFIKLFLRIKIVVTKTFIVKRHMLVIPHWEKIIGFLL
jgi:hypothetical protein